MSGADRLDVCACGVRVQEELPAAFAVAGAIADTMLQPNNIRPTLAQWFADRDARRAMLSAVARAAALGDLHAQLVALHEAEAFRIRIESRIFPPGAP